MLICAGLLAVSAVLAAALIPAPAAAVPADSVACKPHCDVTGPAVQPDVSRPES